MANDNQDITGMQPFSVYGSNQKSVVSLDDSDKE